MISNWVVSFSTLISASMNAGIWWDGREEDEEVALLLRDPFPSSLECVEPVDTVEDGVLASCMGSSKDMIPNWSIDDMAKKESSCQAGSTFPPLCASLAAAAA